MSPNAVKDWRVAPGGGGTAAGTVVGGRAEAASSLAWACAIRTGTEDDVNVDDDVDDDVDDVLVVRAREELVVLVELCSAAVSISAAGATANPVAGVAAAVDVVLTEVVVVVSFVALFTLKVAAVAAAADLGTAVHCRPLMVVKKAPCGRPTDAIFNSQSLPDGRVRRGQSLRNEEKRKKGIQIQAQTGREKRS